MSDETSDHDPDTRSDDDLDTAFDDELVDFHPDDDFDELDKDDDDDELDDETAAAIAEAERAMAEARNRLIDVPAEVVITNHVMGLYELAAIHLSATPPDLRQSVLAIDSVACLVDGLGERLGDDYPTMRDALNNIRMAFVQIKNQTESPVAPD